MRNPYGRLWGTFTNLHMWPIIYISIHNRGCTIMPLNKIYQVRFLQTYQTGGKASENVFFYDHTAGSGSSAALGAAFGSVVVPLINAIQTQVMKNVGINVINLGDLSDFAPLATAGLGAISGATLPPHAAVTYTTKVNTRAVRKGGKRIGGVPESAQTNGVIDDDGYFANVELLRIQLFAELTSLDDTWLPVVIKRVKTLITGTVPPQYTYRLPTTDAELVVGQITVALTTRNVGHQVSREL